MFQPDINFKNSVTEFETGGLPPYILKFSNDLVLPYILGMDIQLFQFQTLISSVISFRGGRLDDSVEFSWLERNRMTTAPIPCALNRVQVSF